MPNVDKKGFSALMSTPARGGVEPTKAVVCVKRHIPFLDKPIPLGDTGWDFNICLACGLFYVVGLRNELERRLAERKEDSSDVR